MIDYRIEVSVSLPGQDSIELSFLPDGTPKVSFVVCSRLKNLILACQKTNQHPAHWHLPTGNGHAELLLKEFILKAQGKWPHPYQHSELCHCRVVSTEKVETAILNGAHTTEKVSRETSASTSCGSCRPDVQNILDFRLSRN